MRVDEQTLGECVEAALRAWPTYKAYACPGSLDARDMVRAALAALPEPEPVPGAAVRFRVTREEWHEAWKVPFVGGGCGDTFRELNQILARRPATDEAEAFERGRAEGRSQANGTFRAKLADLESQLAAVTEERDELQGAQVLNRSAIAGLKRERDEALLKAERAQVSCQAAIDDARKACAARDEALAKLAAVEMERDRWEETANCISVDASAKLAARPEPVVIDEALAERVLLDLEQGQAHPGSLSRGYIQVALAALRRAFGGDRASVSVPQGDDKLAGELEITSLRSQLSAMRSDRDKRKDELDAIYGLCEARHFESKTVLVAVEGLTADHDELRAELEKTRAELEAERPRMHSDACDEHLLQMERECAQLRAELERAKAYIASMEELGEKQSGIAQSLRAELERTRTALEATQGELEDALGNRDLQQLRDELADCKSRLEGYQRTNRELRDKWNAELREAGRLGRELEKTRAELEACKRGHASEVGAFQSLVRRFRELSKQHEALRAACTLTEAEANVLDRGGAAYHLEMALRRVQAALLKPAPAWQHISSDGDSHTFQHGETGRMTTLEGFATWQEAAQCLDEPAPAEADPNEALRLAVRLAEREVYVPERYRTESAEPIADWVPGWGPKRRTTPEAEPLQHPPPESAMVDADDPDLPESLRTHLNNRAAESAVVEQPCRNPACCPDAPWPKPRIAHDMPSPRTLSPEEMARATAEARELRAKMDLATVGMEDESLPPDRHIERAVAALAERVERLERAR